LKPSNIKEEMTMRPKTIFMLLAIVILLPGFAGAAGEKDFEVQTTENLINLCLVAGAVAGTAGGYLYDHHEKAQKKAHDQTYEQGYEAGKKSQ
jgi:hypothetical protein